MYIKLQSADGDIKYSNKASKYYKQHGLKAVVKYIPEKKQPEVVEELLTRVRPDILVVTGHDSMLRKGINYYSLSNYQNSKYFIATVERARLWERYSGHPITIFSGACQSFFEAIMEAGANFASSPERIMIDFSDPLIVAEKIAKTDEIYCVSMDELACDLRDGMRGIGGTGSRGKKVVLVN